MVSEADREVELFVRAEIGKAYPDDGIVGEEHAPKQGTTGYDWVIDPIDGTANFVKGIPAWCVVIACARGRRTVTGVIHDPCRTKPSTAKPRRRRLPQRQADQGQRLDEPRRRFGRASASSNRRRTAERAVPLHQRPDRQGRVSSATPRAR
jgi:fructose-1,6-bisphosphatase/inositol monophosphatase family enzyme